MSDCLFVQRCSCQKLIFRSASDEVFAVLNSVPKLLVEKGSVDEAYIDLTRLIDERINAIGADSILDDVIPFIKLPCFIDRFRL